MASRKGSRLWEAAFRVASWLTRQSPMREVIVTGRDSGHQHRVRLPIFEIGGNWYAGHPNGESTGWVREVAATRAAIVVGRDGQQVKVVCIPLVDGSERAAVIAAAGRQPFPANLVYRAGRRHIEAVGNYFRLQPINGHPID